MLCLAFAFQGLPILRPQASSPNAIARPPIHHVDPVPSLSRGDIRRLLGRSRAGSDADPVLSLSAAVPFVAGRAWLDLRDATGVDPEYSEITFFARNGGFENEPYVIVHLAGLKKGTPYLVVFNLSADNARVRIDHVVNGQSTGTVDSDLPELGGNLPCLFTATQDTMDVVTIFARKKKGQQGDVVLKSVDVHVVK